ncbi:hypothetical protein NMG60_11024033 [Bertholletia excelsa]
MKVASFSVGGRGHKRRFPSKGLRRHLKEQRVKLYIIRRCIVILLCWHD